MKVLQIRWQRLVDERGQTCDRCAATEAALHGAFQKLKRSMKELGIEVTLEKKALSPCEFSKDPLRSNQVWIAGKPIEEWLSATVGQSQCCSTCGDAQCRTLCLGGKTYEAVPTELILRAGLIAGAQLLEGEPGGMCCPTPGSLRDIQGCCPPSAECEK